MQIKRFQLALLACFLLLGALPAWTQATTSLSGTVTDISGAVVPGASVTLKSEDTGSVRTVNTNRGGGYEFPQIIPGRYDIEVSSPKFATTKRTGMDVLVSQPATVNIALQIATDTTQVTVIANEEPVLNTTDATLGNTFDAERIEDLPSSGRNSTVLLSLEPGAAYFGSGTSALSNDTRSGAVNGGRSDQNNITLDGVDVNDLNYGYAFQPVFRLTPDALSEFRVTTSNPNSAEGRSSGAQIALVTKSGTNKIHGTVYEYNKNNVFQANQFFVKQTDLANGIPNRPAKQIYNVFGTALGGPIKKDRLFLFLNYEGQRQTIGQNSNSDVVPTASFRAGNLTYVCAPAQSTCTGTAPVPGFSTYTLTPAQIASMDPQGIGESSGVLALLNALPLPNNPTAGDGLNFEGYDFIFSAKSYLNAYIGRVDWNVTANGKHTLFWRGNLQNDYQPGGAPTYPGQPPSSVNFNNSKGFASGYTWVVNSNLVNNLAFGLTRQGLSDGGTLSSPYITFPFTTLAANTSTSSNIVPVYNLADNLSSSVHGHNLSFGTDIRFIQDIGSNNGGSYANAGGVATYLNGGTVAGSGGAFDSAVYGFPRVNFNAAYNGRPAYNNAILTATGILSEGSVTYTATKTGTPLPQNAPVVTNYRWNEYDFYAQDSWKLTKDLTLTYGLHYSYQQVPAEVTGSQVGVCQIVSGACAPGAFSLTKYLNNSSSAAAAGAAANTAGELGFPLNGRYNGQPDYWTPDKLDIGPRFAFAYSPSPVSGIWNKILGNGKSTIRGGYSLVYDHFGAGIVNTFDAAGSYGLVTKATTTVGTFNAACPTPPGNCNPAPRFTASNAVPSVLLPPAPPVGFPGIPPASGPNSAAIYWSEDSAIKTPYAHQVNFSIAREIRNGSSIEVSYVGRYSHRLLEQEDVAAPTNLAAAGTTYFAAARQMALLVRSGASISSVTAAPYWETLFGALDNKNIGYGSGLTATQNVFGLFKKFEYNETQALFNLDVANSVSAAGVNPSNAYPSYRFYHDQFSSLYAWRSMGNSNYNALQAVYRQRFGFGLHADFNYALSKSLDLTSQAEREGVSGLPNGSQILNTWMPNQLYGDSDFDIRQQINANYVWDIPYGRGRQFGAHLNRFVNDLIGDWQTTGIIRWTSGLPFGVLNGNTNYPTNWNIEGYATKVGSVPAGRGALQQRFSNTTAALAAFTFTLPGDSGTRTPLRGDGYFDVDAGLGKQIEFTDRFKLKLGIELFNVSNSVRFDPKTISADLGAAATFGQAFQSLNTPRQAQFYGRFLF